MKTICENGKVVEQWYDRNTKSYITRIIDSNGNQIGDADYSGDKISANYAKKTMIKEQVKNASKKKKKSDDRWIQKAIPKSNEGKFEEWCKDHGHRGVCQACIEEAMQEGGIASQMANFAINVSKGKYKHHKKKKSESNLMKKIASRNIYSKLIDSGLKPPFTIIIKGKKVNLLAVNYEKGEEEK